VDRADRSFAGRSSHCSLLALGVWYARFRVAL